MTEEWTPPSFTFIGRNGEFVYEASRRLMKRGVRCDQLGPEIFIYPNDCTTHFHAQRSKALFLITAEGIAGGRCRIEVTMVQGDNAAARLIIEQLIEDLDADGFIEKGRSKTGAAGASTKSDKFVGEKSRTSQQPSATTRKPMLKANKWLLEQYYDHGKTKIPMLVKEWERLRQDEHPDLPTVQDPVASMRKVILAERKRREKNN